MVRSFAYVGSDVRGGAVLFCTLYYVGALRRQKSGFILLYLLKRDALLLEVMTITFSVYRDVV